MSINSMKRESELDLLDIIWKLLSQWKAILFFGIFMAIVVAGVKYASDIRSYNASVVASQQEAKMIDNIDDQIDSFFANLSPEDRKSVEQAVRQFDRINDLYEYQDNSLLSNLDLNEARILSTGFQLTNVENPTMLDSLFTGYISAFDSNEATQHLSESMSSEVAPEYIRELISFTGDYDSGAEVPDPSEIINIYIVIPKNADSDNVSSAIFDIMKDRCSVLSSTYYPHDIKLLFSDLQSANVSSLNRLSVDSLNRLFDLQSRNRQLVDSFNDEQKATYNSITSLKRRASLTRNSSDYQSDISIAKPTISKKYVVLGFIIGLILYVGIYLIFVLFQKDIGSLKCVQHYTGIRVLGSLYDESSYSGLASLLHSKAIIRYRYKNLLNVNDRLAKLTDTIESICKHNSIESTSIINLAPINNSLDSHLNQLCSELSERGIQIQLISEPESQGEIKMIDVKNAICVIGYTTKIAAIDSFITLANDYSIDLLGSVYYEEV